MKKLFGILLGVALGCTALFSGCYYDNEQDLYGTGGNNNTTCDSAGTKYAAVVTILTNNSCFSCHSEAEADASGGGYHLEGYDNLKAVSEHNNNLYKSISQDGTVSPMPKGGSKMADCDIAKVYAWIKAGYPQ